jgi:hypothetical protein
VECSPHPMLTRRGPWKDGVCLFDLANRHSQPSTNIGCRFRSKRQREAIHRSRHDRLCGLRSIDLRYPFVRRDLAEREDIHGPLRRSVQGFPADRVRELIETRGAIARQNASWLPTTNIPCRPRWFSPCI